MECDGGMRSDTSADMPKTRSNNECCGEPCCLRCTLVEHMEGNGSCKDGCPQVQVIWDFLQFFQHVPDFQPSIFMDLERERQQVAD